MSFLLLLAQKFVNKKCLNKKEKCYRDSDCMKSGIFGTKRTILNRKGPLLVVSKLDCKSLDTCYIVPQKEIHARIHREVVPCNKK